MKTLFERLDKLKSECDSKEHKEEIEELKSEISLLRTKSGIKKLVGKKRISKAIRDLKYEKELVELQVELIKLQNYVYESKKRVLIIFEGRDTAGKGGAIKRFIQYLNPRKYKTVALPKPNDVEKGQFYFQRYFKHLPNEGEIVFFDRSWYNRAVVEPVFDFCSKEQYEKFMKEVNLIEKLLVDDGVELIKFWFDISKETQQKRFEERETNPLKKWKLSELDKKAQEMWDKTTFYVEKMLKETNTAYSPWISIDSNSQKDARLEAIKYVLKKIPYDK